MEKETDEKGFCVFVVMQIEKYPSTVSAHFFFFSFK